MEIKTKSIEEICEIMGRSIDDLEFTLTKPKKGESPQITKGRAHLKEIWKKSNIQYETI
ncbi:MAG: hypothetical protein JJV89_01075 [Desulfosarcina sp.]|nr:hypothetical protein [Desulfobacterales bacterium]